MAAHIVTKKFNEDDFTEVNHIKAMEEELSDIELQLSAMKEYRDILFKRIRMFKNEK